MKSRISRPEAEAALVAIYRGMEQIADWKQAMPLHVQAATPEEMDPISQTLTELKSLRDRAIMLESLIGASGLDRQISNWAIEIRLIIERTLGESLCRLGLPGGDRKSQRRANRLLLESCGISRSLSHQWQLEAKLPPDAFAGYVRQTSLQGKKPSSRGLRRLAKVHAESANLAAEGQDPLCRAFAVVRGLAGRRKRFGCVLIDLLQAPAGSCRPRRSSIDPRLALLPVMEVVAAQVHLYVKVTPESLDEGRQILDAWGFSSTTLLVPAKGPLDPHGSLLAVHDMLLLGVRDELGRFGHGLPNWIEDGGDFPRQSGEGLLDAIERMSPPPYLAIFAVGPFSKKWTAIAT